MKDIRLFDYKNLTEITENSCSCLDDSLIDIVKKHTELFFNVRPLAAGYKIGRDGEIDILALDGTYSPAVILFQKSANGNIITEGVFYLDWITQHRTTFNELALKAFPGTSTDKIN